MANQPRSEGEGEANNRLPVDQLTDGPGVSRIDPADPAAPMYRLLQATRTPLTLREMMIDVVRTGYLGQPRQLAPQ